MTIAATFGLAAAVGVLLATLWIGVRRDDAAIAVNAVASLAAVASPLAVEAVVVGLEGGAVSFGPVLPLSIAIAGILHMLGMLGWYDTVWWWDHVTHVASAALVAAIVYAWVVVAGPGALPGPLGTSVATATIGLTLAAGIAWELLEHAARAVSERVGVEHVLKRYGPYDTPMDVAFDGLGAILVVAVDGRMFLPLFEPTPAVTRTLLHWSIGAVTAISIGSAAVALVGRRL
ncbi:hypothetical protein [Halovivax limisalsi]|uniref:hypothetical protein n=1 Tax=Halovivax limisalsi TaxID=1453760 RepID=UPI001FFCE970|nr:hypothetical protein [Halovivax limisalsi]